MASRERDWMVQAVFDLAHARHALEVEDFEWAAFAAHQASEKAIKAVLQSMSAQVIMGHALIQMLEAIGEKVRVPKEVLEAARLLDRHYLPARYPDAFAAGAPHEHYGNRDASQAVRNADKIVRFCQGRLARPRASQS